MKKILVKICGNTNLHDSRISLEYGADLLGFIFYERSPRYITPEKAYKIISELKNHFPFESVGVFVNPEKEYVDYVINTANINILQFHGEESLSFIKSFSKKTIKAFRIKDSKDILKCDEYHAVDYLLLDTFSKESYGGTGKVFDWKMLADFKYREKLFLSGGISGSNIEDAVNMVKPHAVDLCSSVEKEPGLKDRDKLKKFFSLLAISTGEKNK